VGKNSVESHLSEGKEVCIELSYDITQTAHDILWTFWERP